MALISDESCGDTTGAALLDQVHRQALRTPIWKMADELQVLLGCRVTAQIVGVKDPATILRRVRGSATAIRSESEARLRIAYEIMTLLMRFEAPDTVRAWFIGMCPQLDDVSPARAIHGGDLHGALDAARTFAAYG